MKKLFKISLLILISSIMFSACKKCKNEPPRARIINNGTKDASVQIKTSGGNTININNVASGTSSTYDSYSAGAVTFTITVDKVSFVKVQDVKNCFDYDIAVDASNSITALEIDRNK